MIRAGEVLIAQPNPYLSNVSLLSFFKQNLPEKPTLYWELGFKCRSAHPAQDLAYSKCSINRVSPAA